MRRWGFILVMLISLPAPASAAERVAEARIARALSRILGVEVTAPEFEVRDAGRLAATASLPTPLRAIAGSTGKRFIRVRLDERLIEAVRDVAFTVPERWRERLGGADVVVVSSDSWGYKSCWFSFCEGDGCKVIEIWVREGAKCPNTGYCSDNDDCVGEQQKCRIRACDPDGACSYTWIQAGPGPCPEDLCTSGEECQATKECPVGSCLLDVCFETTAMVLGTGPCPEPVCRVHDDCSGGDDDEDEDSLLDGLLETQSAAGL